MNGVKFNGYMLSGKRVNILLLSLHCLRLTLEWILTCKPSALEVNLYVHRITWITAQRQLALKRNLSS